MRFGEVPGPVAHLFSAHDADVVFAAVHLLQFGAGSGIALVEIADDVALRRQALEHRANRARNVEKICDADVARAGREIVNEERDLLLVVRKLFEAKPARRDVRDQSHAVGNGLERADLFAGLARADRRERLDALGLRRDDVADVFEHRDAVLRVRQVDARKCGIDGRGVDARIAEVVDEFNRAFWRSGEHRAGQVQRDVVVHRGHQRLVRLGFEQMLARNDVRVEHRRHRADYAQASLFPRVDRGIEHRQVPIGQKQIVRDESDAIPRLRAVRLFKPRLVPVQIVARRGEHALVCGVIDAFVLDLFRQRSVPVVGSRHEVLHEIQEHVFDVLDAAVVPIAGKDQTLKNRTARELRHHRRRLDHLLHAQKALTRLPVCVGLLVPESRDETLEVHRHLLERARLAMVVFETERLEHQPAKPRIGNVVPEELDVIQLAGAIHLREQGREAVDRLDRHRLPADQDVGLADRRAETIERRGVVEIRGAEVFERPVQPRLLAQRRKSQPDSVRAFVGSPRRISDDFHGLTLRQRTREGRDHHHARVRAAP